MFDVHKGRTILGVEIEERSYTDKMHALISYEAHERNMGQGNDLRRDGSMLRRCIHVQGEVLVVYTHQGDHTTPSVLQE